MITNSTLNYKSEVFVNGLKKYYVYAIFGFFLVVLKIGIDVDMFKVFTSLGGGRKGAA